MKKQEIDLDRLIVVDIETLVNCFLINCKDVASGQKRTFTFFDHPDYYDQPESFFKFLRACVNNNYTFITFNGLGFDMQVLDMWWEECNNKKDSLLNYNIQTHINLLYKKAQEIIALQDQEERFLKLKTESRLFIRVIDLFKQMHYDRPAKATSLKALEFALRMENIQDMPIEHYQKVKKEQIKEIEDYCWNDVEATYQFYLRIQDQTKLRIELSNEHGLNLLNASETRMSKDIFGKDLSKAMGVTYTELKKMQTKRDEIVFKDIIFPYIQFQTKELQDVLDIFKEKVLDCRDGSKDGFELMIPYGGLEVYLGLGGIHACVDKGIYTHEDNEEILDADVKK